MADYYNGINVVLNMSNLNNYGNDYDYISWPDSINSTNNYEDDSTIIHNLHIGNTQSEYDFSGEVVVLYEDSFKDYICKTNNFRCGDFYIKVLNKNFGRDLDSNGDIQHTTLKGDKVTINTDTYHGYTRLVETTTTGEIKHETVYYKPLDMNNYNQINWLIVGYNKLNVGDTCDFILRSAPVFTPYDLSKKLTTNINIIEQFELGYKFTATLTYDDEEHEINFDYYFENDLFFIDSDYEFDKESYTLTIGNSKFYVIHLILLLFAEDGVKYSIPYSNLSDYRTNYQNYIDRGEQTDNSKYKKIITTNKYDELIVSLNNSNSKTRLPNCDGLFYFYLLCDYWNKYHEFKPIDCLSILKKGLYSFRCYNDLEEVPGYVNIITYDENCRLLDNNILVGTNTLINLNDFSVNYTQYESWMDLLSRIDLINLLIETLNTDLKTWTNHDRWVQWELSSNKTEKIPIPKNINTSIINYYNRVNNDLLIDNFEVRNYYNDWKYLFDPENTENTEQDGVKDEIDKCLDQTIPVVLTNIPKIFNSPATYEHPQLYECLVHDRKTVIRAQLILDGNNFDRYLLILNLFANEDYALAQYAQYIGYVTLNDNKCKLAAEMFVDCMNLNTGLSVIGNKLLNCEFELYEKYLNLTITNLAINSEIGFLKTDISKTRALRSNNPAPENPEIPEDETIKDIDNVGLHLNLNIPKNDSGTYCLNEYTYKNLELPLLVNVEEISENSKYNVDILYNNDNLKFTYTINESIEGIDKVDISSEDSSLNLELKYFYIHDDNVINLLKSLYRNIKQRKLFLLKQDNAFITSDNFFIDSISKLIKTVIRIEKDTENTEDNLHKLSIEFKDVNGITLNKIESTFKGFDGENSCNLTELDLKCESNFIKFEYKGNLNITVDLNIKQGLYFEFSDLYVETTAELLYEENISEKSVTKLSMIDYLTVATQRVIQDLKLLINTTVAGENYTNIKKLDSTIDLLLDWLGIIKFIPDDPNYFSNAEQNNLSLSIIYKEKLDNFNNINYYNNKNEYVSCNYVQNYYLGSKDYSFKTFINDGILFSFTADYKSPYYVKGRYRELDCREMFPVVYNVSTVNSGTGTTANVVGLYLDAYNFNSNKHFNHVSGICHLEIGGKNAQIFVVKYDHNGKKYVYDKYSSWEADKERNVDISEQTAVSGFKTDNNTLYLLPTFLYKTGKDKLAKSSVNANGHTVSIDNEPNNFTSRLTSLGYLRSGKVYPGSLWNREISEWEGLYLGLLSNLYFSYTTSSKAPYNINYAGYKKYETSFTKDVLVSVSPRSLNDCNKYFTIRDANYVDWIDELTKYRTGNINQDLNVNLQLEGVIKNFPMTFNFEYKLPVIDMTEPKSDDTVIHSIYGDTITKIKDLKSDIIYTLDGNGNPINVNNYPYVPKCDINLFVISSNNIKYKGKPTTMVCILDLTSRGLKKDKSYITISDYNNQGTYSILTTQRRNWIGKKFDEYLTGLPSNADFIE